jgi:hypothetical protein
MKVGWVVFIGALVLVFSAAQVPAVRCSANNCTNNDVGNTYQCDSQSECHCGNATSCYCTRAFATCYCENSTYCEITSTDGTAYCENALTCNYTTSSLGTALNCGKAQNCFSFNVAQTNCQDAITCVANSSFGSSSKIDCGASITCAADDVWYRATPAQSINQSFVCTHNEDCKNYLTGNLYNCSNNNGDCYCGNAAVCNCAGNNGDCFCDSASLCDAESNNGLVDCGASITCIKNTQWLRASPKQSVNHTFICSVNGDCTNHLTANIYNCSENNGDCLCGNAVTCYCSGNNGGCFCQNSNSCNGVGNNGPFYCTSAQSSCTLNGKIIPPPVSPSEKSNHTALIVGVVAAIVVAGGVVAAVIWKRSNTNKYHPLSNETQG